MAPYTNNYISLFTGIGGLDEGVRIALPTARTICYVEREANCIQILLSRIEEGSMDDAPIWDDVATFDGRLFLDRVAGIIGGFPCQDMSVAGAQAGIRGDRSGLWFEYLRIIRESKPNWIFIENVPGLLGKPGSDLESDEPGDGESPEWAFRNIDAVLGPLADVGYDAEWCCLRASDVGASHQRNRVFILAVANSRRAGSDRNSSLGRERHQRT